MYYRNPPKPLSFQSPINDNYVKKKKKKKALTWHYYVLTVLSAVHF